MMHTCVCCEKMHFYSHCFIPFQQDIVPLNIHQARKITANLMWIIIINYKHHRTKSKHPTIVPPQIHRFIPPVIAILLLTLHFSKRKCEFEWMCVCAFDVSLLTNVACLPVFRCLHADRGKMKAIVIWHHPPLNTNNPYPTPPPTF